MPGESVTFGKRLKDLRESAGLSQQQLAAMAGIGQKSISHWELGSREPLWSNVLSLAKALGVDCRAFLEPPAVAEAPKPGRGRPSTKGKAETGSANKKPNSGKAKAK
ncbi:MAG: helix-turn-helix transcriptional regulator [Gemmataceae bacterium]